MAANWTRVSVVSEVVKSLHVFKIVAGGWLDFLMVFWDGSGGTTTTTTQFLLGLVQQTTPLLLLPPPPPPYTLKQTHGEWFQTSLH